jgi:hypothetical protein
VKLRAPIFITATVAVLLASALEPLEAFAQRRAVVRVAPRRTVVVGVGVGSHYYRRPYYDPWYFGYPWYAGYYAYPQRYYRYDLGASLRLQVSPRQTEVFVDGYYAGNVDEFDGVFQRLDIEPGEHEIELYLPGHRTVVQRVYLQPGKTSRIRLEMQPLGPGEPEPVKPSGTSAITPSRPGVGPGASRRPGPPPRGSRADDDGGVVRTDPDVRTANDYGSLALRVQPGPATITIDGERWEGPEGNERLVVELPPGRHVIEVQKDGYRRYTTEITVRPGEATTLNVALTRN